MTTLPSGVDGAVRRISTEYEVRSLVALLSSWSDATVGQGVVVNQVKSSYNGFSQLLQEEQATNGAVAAGTPAVQIAYADGTGNVVRPTTLTYPNGRALAYNYGAAGGADDRLSRPRAIVDGDTGPTTLAEYGY
ncbi:MAG: hypothetical protein ACRC1K_09455, partial [Planctomycetia bacterium]